MGPDPSVAELLDTMQCMFTMIARQTHIEQSIMDRLNYDTGEEEMGQILRFFHGALPRYRPVMGILLLLHRTIQICWVKFVRIT